MTKNLLAILLPFLLLITTAIHSNAQCTGCTLTYNGTGTTNFNLNTGDVLCITGNASGLNVNFNGSATICVASGITWNASGANFGNNAVVNVYGTLQFDNGNFNSPTVFNIFNGATFNAGVTGFNGNLTVNNQGTTNFTNTGLVTVQGNTTFNNLATGVFNATTPSKVNFVGSGAIFNNSNVANFRNLENNEGDFTNNSNGVITVKGELYNHGEFKNYGNVLGTCDGEPICAFTVGNKGVGRGFKNLGGTVDYKGNTTFDGAVINDGLIYVHSGNLDINYGVTGTNGQIVVENGVSTIGVGGCYTGTGLKFCDKNTAGNGFDAINNPGCNASNWTINCTFTLLAVKIISFDAFYVNDETKLRWVVSLDNSMDYFIVQKSTDGANFSNVETIRSNNATGALHTYTSSAVDKNLIAYYRLAAYDKNNRITYSNVIRVGNKDNSLVKVSPNPVVNSIVNIEVPDANVTTLVNIYTIDGRKVISKSFTGQNKYTLTLPNNANGQLISEIFNGATIKRFNIVAIKN